MVLNNCFDVWKLHLNTFAFDALVCLEDLPVDVHNHKIAYDLNFGPVDKNELHKIVFKIKNVSNSVYKFQFGQIRELTFSPCVGHLYEGSEKTVIAAFRTKRHIDMKQKEILLTITEIKYHPRHIFPLPWDDRQNTNIAVFKTPTSDTDCSETPCVENAIYESNEPPYDEVDKPSFIQLLVNAQCDYANYFCETQELSFQQTYVHTMLTKTITVENRSGVNLEINWTITDYLDAKNVPSAPRPSLFEKMQISESEMPAVKSVEDLKIFSVEPVSYIIPPRTKYEFSVHHTPVEEEVREYYLRANMKNLDPSTNDLVVALRGESKSFPYHMCSVFMKDYEASEHRFKTYCGLPEGVETKVLDFLSLGVGSECNRSLFVTNATFHPFSFVWRNIKMDHEEPSFFHCEFNKGLISPRKATRTNFVFIPQNRGQFTDYFLFEPDDPYMPRYSLLLQGLCREPKVYFECASLALGATLLNDLVQKEVILTNDEDIKIHFSFKKNSLFSDNQQILSISPMSGLMEAKSRNILRLTVRPTKEAETIFTPKCIVQYMSEPLQFNLLMNVIHVSSKFVYFGRELSQIEVKPNVPLTINLGVIVQHKREEIKFELSNTSTIGLYYSWSIEDKQLRAKIQFSRREGYLRSSEKIAFKASLLAVRKCILKNITLKLKILYGPTYVLKVEASTQKPKFTFSYLKYDFGKCLIQDEPTHFYHAPLDFKNNNEWPVVLEYGKNCIPEFLVDFKSAVVSPEECKRIEIYFSPLKKGVYETALNFFVDSKRVIIRLLGEGVPLALEVLSLTDKFLDFGKVRVGKSVQKSIKVLNSGECTVDVIFALPSKLPHNRKGIETKVGEFCIEPAKIASIQEEAQPEQKTANKNKGKPGDKDDTRSTYSKDQRSMKINSKEKLTKDLPRRRQSDKVSRVISLKSLEKMHTDSEMQIMQSKEQLNKFLVETLEIYPKKMVRLPPNKTADVVVKFKPTETKEKFQSNIFFQVQNYREPIVTIMGSVVDASFALNKDVINFGNVVVGYASEETIILMNEGYIGGKFRWYLEKNSSYVSFIGGDGYSPPNSKVTTTIIFKPGHVQCVFKFKAYCQIDKYQKRLELILTGGSMNLPPPFDTLQFSAAVREEGYQKIEFKNETKDIWNTEPVFTGNYFSGAKILNVPKESSVTYQVVYSPMKLIPSQHKGTVFFPLPNGMGRLYALEGTVLPPNPIAEISREICCKTYHSEVLKVENWLGLRQQFKVLTEVLDGNTTRMIYKITSNDNLEVPPFGKRDFKWTVYVVNEGRLTFKITFLNEKTKEFLYYVVSLKITPLEVTIDNIEFVTCVRVPAVKKIIVQNPLPEAVDFNVSSSSPYVIVNSSFIALPYEKYDLSVKYLPVKVESSNAVLTISNPAVGNYTYNLILEAQEPNSEPEVRFQTQFGQNVMKTVPLPRLLQNMEVVPQIVDNTSFEVVKVYTQSEKPYMEVLFFPSDIGITRAVLEASSFVGDYTFPLVGESVNPEPQGPLTLLLGESITIDINNPFDDTKTFQFSVDNNVFHVKPSEETIRGKKSAKITVSVPGKRLSRPRSGTSMSDLLRVGKFTGKLTVLCENGFKWIYYLQCQAGNK
ncbi:hydrocephalus-inducing protein homolog [Coccinella septempunctata]|uniref:hydrocephalus-inducing protein homolog n=1 Tax=Coccinella septempunctata TaxID=41139 RepID=UPI001D07F734|nr:hydrocephalus-inducing protein homolog [Coccinella septempunctata]